MRIAIIKLLITELVEEIQMDGFTNNFPRYSEVRHNFFSNYRELIKIILKNNP